MLQIVGKKWCSSFKTPLTLSKENYDNMDKKR